jgi:UDP-GlcNAc:undecaprenyl-phosphate/decaprenyl-phosphate GlcNAc-1-phosphate transferase
MHIHHLLIDCGFTHMQATGILVAVSTLFIALSFMLQHLGTFTLILIIILLATTMSVSLQKTAKKRRLKTV